MRGTQRDRKERERKGEKGLLKSKREDGMEAVVPLLEVQDVA